MRQKSVKCPITIFVWRTRGSLLCPGFPLSRWGEGVSRALAREKFLLRTCLACGQNKQTDLEKYRRNLKEKRGKIMCRCGYELGLLLWTLLSLPALASEFEEEEDADNDTGCNNHDKHNNEDDYPGLDLWTDN